MRGGFAGTNDKAADCQERNFEKAVPVDQVARCRIAVKKTFLRAYFTDLEDGFEKCPELGQSGVMPGAPEVDCAFKRSRRHMAIEPRCSWRHRGRTAPFMAWHWGDANDDGLGR